MVSWTVGEGNHKRMELEKINLNGGDRQREGRMWSGIFLYGEGNWRSGGLGKVVRRMEIGLFLNGIRRKPMRVRMGK